MERWLGKIALVTGANAGIGTAIAKALVLAGLEVIGLDKTIEHIEELAGSLNGTKGKLHAIKCDLENEHEILQVFEWANNELGGIDVLVNNAAILTPIYISECSTENFQRILDVNLLAAAICIRETMKSMKSRETEGHIFCLNSVLGYNVRITKYPKGLYPATKYGLRGLVETIKQEIDFVKDNIRTTSIIAGLVRTKIFTANSSSNDIFNDMPCVETKDIADSIIYALSTPPYVCSLICGLNLFLPS